MRAYWILDTEDEAERTKFLEWCVELGFTGMYYGLDGTTASYNHWFRQELGWSGKLGISLGVIEYPLCCGAYILTQPYIESEYKGKGDKSRTLSWPVPQPPVVGFNGSIRYDSSEEAFCAGSENTLGALKNCISRWLKDQIGRKGVYMLTDYADGHGPLFRLVNHVMDRNNFSLERGVQFRNGNTGKLLGTWICRNTNYVVDNQPNMSLDKMVEFAAERPEKKKEEPKPVVTTATEAPAAPLLHDAFTGVIAQQRQGVDFNRLRNIINTIQDAPLETTWDPDRVTGNINEEEEDTDIEPLGEIVNGVLQRRERAA